LIFLIAALGVTRITGVSHWRLAKKKDFKNKKRKSDDIHLSVTIKKFY
jgi:hypothetical protein